MKKRDTQIELEGGEKKMPTIQKMIKVNECICSRCFYHWLPRKAELPIVCPKCRSNYWNRERVRGVASENKAK